MGQEGRVPTPLQRTQTPSESVAEGGEAYEMMREGGLCAECRRSQIVGVLSRGTPSAAGWNGPRSLPVQGLNCSVLLLMNVRPRID